MSYIPVILGSIKQNGYLRFHFRLDSFSAIWNLSKTYFCELVLGFSPDRNQTTAEMFSGKWISIIIEKKLKFQLTFAKVA